MHTAIESFRTPDASCPACGSSAESAETRCRRCRVWLAGPHLAELRHIDVELGRVDAARAWLISRRAAVLDELIRSASESPASEFTGVAEPTSPAAPSGAIGDSAVRQPRAALSGRAVARLLLAAGASLVV